MSRRLRNEALAELRLLLGDDNGITRVASLEQRVHRDPEPMAV